MNYCTKCGNKLSKEDNYCTKCGSRIKRDDYFQKPILILGICLVLFSSFILGFISWKNLNEMYRIIFFGFETCLFFLLSFILKKIESKLYRLFFIIGLVLIPWTLSLIPYYGLIKTISSGALMHTYLALLYVFVTIIYLLINRKYKSTLLNYLSLITLLISFINTGLIFDNSISIISLLITAYILVLYLLSFTKLFTDNMRKVFKILSMILILLVTPLLITAFTNIKYEILNVFTLFLYLLLVYLILFKENYKVFNIFSIFTSLAVTYSYVITVFFNNYMFLFIISVISILMHFISLLSNDKVHNIFTLIFSYMTMLVSIIISYFIVENYALSLVISILLSSLIIYNILVSKYEEFTFLLPISFFINIIVLFKLLSNFKFIYVTVGTSLLYLLFYIILKLMKKKNSFIFIFASLLIIMLSAFTTDSLLIMKFIISLIILFIYVLANVNDEDKAFKVISFILFNLVIMIQFGSYPLYYGLLLAGSLSLLSNLFLQSVLKLDLKPYLLYSEIVIFVITLFNSMNYSYIILSLNLVIYALSYLVLLKNHNIMGYRILYIMLGLISIIRVINILIVPIVISSIISILVILIIIVIMYLLDIETNFRLALISLVILLPYYSLTTYINITELYFIPFIIYDIVLTEIYKFKKEESKKISTLIPLSIICYLLFISNSGVFSIIIDVIISLIYILIGYIRKYDYLIYLGIVFIVLTVGIGLSSIVNSTILVVGLILVGFILIGIGLIAEFNKKNNEKK